MSDKPILRRLLLPVALVALAAPVLGACGDDEEAEPDAMTSTESTAAPAGDSAGEAEATDKVAIKDFQFKPATVEVKVGTTVTWTNEDGFAHTATADDKSFDTGNLDKGQTGTATFEKAGTFKYICTIHNSMVGTVIVK
jgi:plastocyanin